MSNPDRVRTRFLDAVAGNHVPAVLACYAEDAVLTAPEGRYEGRDYIGAYYRPQFEAFPDGHLDVLATHDHGDVAVTEWRFTGTHTGPIELPGGEVIPPTGKRVTQRGADIAFTVDGLIREHRVYYDQLEALAQLETSAASRG